MLNSLKRGGHNCKKLESAYYLEINIIFGVVELSKHWIIAQIPSLYEQMFHSRIIKIIFLLKFLKSVVEDTCPQTSLVVRPS